MERMAPSGCATSWLSVRVAAQYVVTSQIVVRWLISLQLLAFYIHQFHGMSVHFYGTRPEDLINYVTKMHDEFQLPIWLTEFACTDFGGGPQCNEGQIQNFYKVAIDYLEKTDYVVSYFAFGEYLTAFRDPETSLLNEISTGTLPGTGNVNPLNHMMGPDGKPNALGRKYINVEW